MVIVGDQDSAQELVAEAFARACGSWRTVSRHPAPAAWVVRTALNLNISRWRRRRREELITAVRQSVDGVRMNVPAEQIVSRSRAIRASGHRRLAASITAVAAAGSVVLGLGLSGALGAAPNGGTGTIRTAAFTLTKNANGTVTLTLAPSINPAAMPAGTELSFGIEQIPYPPGYPPLRPGFQGIATETFMELIDTNSYTCSSAPSAHPPGNEGASVEYFPGEGWTLISYPAGW